jgi:hypothetical protein
VIEDKWLGGVVVEERARQNRRGEEEEHPGVRRRLTLAGDG